MFCKHRQDADATYAGAVNSVVQCGQRLALIGIVIAHAGQSFTTGSTWLGRFILLRARTNRKMAKPTRMKLMIALMKTPALSVTACCAFASAKVAKIWSR